MHEHTLILNACMNMHIDCRLSCRFVKNVLVLLLYSEHVRKLLFKVTRVDVQPAPKVKKPPQRSRMPTAKLLSQVKKNVCGVCHKGSKSLAMPWSSVICVDSGFTTSVSTSAIKRLRRWTSPALTVAHWCDYYSLTDCNFLILICFHIIRNSMRCYICTLMLLCTIIAFVL